MQENKSSKQNMVKLLFLNPFTYDEYKEVYHKAL